MGYTWNLRFGIYVLLKFRIQVENLIEIDITKSTTYSKMQIALLLIILIQMTL